MSKFRIIESRDTNNEAVFYIHKKFLFFWIYFDQSYDKDIALAKIEREISSSKFKRKVIGVYDESNFTKGG